MGGESYHLEAALQVAPAVIARWEEEHPAFRKARQEGEEFADDTVTRSLAQRAVGYTIERVKLMRIDGKVVPVRYPVCVIPNVKACFLWLANRRPEEWGDVLPRRRPRKVKPESEHDRKVKDFFRTLNKAVNTPGADEQGTPDDQPPQNPG
ncbi:MAG: hypothetical protein OJF62_002076 [Pseudolabrys sp.]|jgi:hypothetical protein|nr:hypothetical protein [Pseudolabrys sp.]